MKKLIFLTVAAFLTAALLSYTLRLTTPDALVPASYAACYHFDTRELIGMDAKDPAFARLHENPKYYRLENPMGAMVSFPADEGAAARGYLIKSKKNTDKWLFVIQEWWGLNDNIKKEAETFYSELGDVNVLAIDLYDGKVASTQDSAMKYMSGAQVPRLESIIKGALTYAGGKARIYTVGWCFGGGWSLQSTILAGNQAAGCVMYYGRPESNLDRLKSIHCDVIGFFGNQDKGINPAAVTAFENNMKAVNRNLQVYRYEAGHGFANPSNPSYNKEATEDSHTKALAFLRARM